VWEHNRKLDLVISRACTSNRQSQEDTLDDKNSSYLFKMINLKEKQLKQQHEGELSTLKVWFTTELEEFHWMVSELSQQLIHNKCIYESENMGLRSTISSLQAHNNSLNLQNNSAIDKLKKFQKEFVKMHQISTKVLKSMTV